MKLLRQHAERHGFNAEYPGASQMRDLPIFGKSTLIKHDPPLPDGTILEWQKTKAEDYTLAQFLEHYLSGLNVSRVEPRPLPKDPEEVLPILAITDAHLGLLASEAETGKDWNMGKSLSDLCGGVEYMVDKMPVCKEAIFWNGGDITHADGLVAATPKSKNSLDVSHRYFDVVRQASQLVRYCIDAMLDKAQTVHVMNDRGNHDEITAWHINEQLRAVYEDEPRVVIPTNDAHCRYLVWKGNMIVTTHGDGCSKWQQLYNYITATWPQEFGRASYVYCMSGHIHHLTSENIGNTIFESHCPMTVADAYHEFKKYKSLRRMQMPILAPQGGEISRITYNPVM